MKIKIFRGRFDYLRGLECEVNLFLAELEADPDISSYSTDYYVLNDFLICVIEYE